MKRPRVRISTLMLLVVIAALSASLIVQKRRADRREAVLRLESAKAAMRGLGDSLLQDWVSVSKSAR